MIIRDDLKKCTLPPLFRHFVEGCLAIYCFMQPATVFADWVAFKPEMVQVLPVGNINLWLRTGSGFVNGCGTLINPFKVQIGQYGVNDIGAKEMLGVTTAALMAARSVDVSYYPNDTCKVDSIVLHND